MNIHQVLTIRWHTDGTNWTSYAAAVCAARRTSRKDRHSKEKILFFWWWASLRQGRSECCFRTVTSLGTVGHVLNSSTWECKASESQWVEADLVYREVPGQPEIQSENHLKQQTNKPAVVIIIIIYNHNQRYNQGSSFLSACLACPCFPTWVVSARKPQPDNLREKGVWGGGGVIYHSQKDRLLMNLCVILAEDHAHLLCTIPISIRFGLRWSRRRK